MFSKTVVLFAFIWGAYAQCDKSKCLVPKHYEELGCKGVTEKWQCCPSRFECLDFKKVDSKKCFYKNVLMKNGDKLNAQNSPPCAVGCFCDSANEVPANFICAVMDCAELFQPPNTTCVVQHDATSCCAKNIICDKNEIRKLKKCDFEGRTYLEGQRIYPKNSCYTCLCTKNFQNIPVERNPNCKKVDCGISVWNTNQVREGCAPIYYGSDRCCPIDWRCPNDNDYIVTPPSNYQCVFGDLRLNVGDVVNSYDKCETCRCLLPPMISCMKNPKCT